MKQVTFAAILLTGIGPIFGQQAVPKWDVEIPEPIANEAAEPAPAPEPIDFTVLTSRTSQVEVTQASEMADLPPMTGTINITVQKVADPGLADPPLPLTALPPDDPGVVARLEELSKSYVGTDLVFLSCDVHDHRRTLLRIYPNGKMGQEVVAWSNLDFNHFGGFSTYRVKDGVDGTLHDFGLLMGIGNVETALMQRSATLTGNEYEAPEIPELPDLAIGGPAFVVVKGEAGSPAMDTLEQVHDLYRKEGVRMEAAYHAREQARAERKAYLLANPPAPADVTVRFWRKPKAQSSPQTQPEVPAP